MSVADLALLLLGMMTALLGGVFLALSQARNWRTVMGAPPVKFTSRAASGIGWVFVLLSLVVCVVRDGWGFAAILWPMLLGSASGIIALILAFRPASLRLPARLMAACSKDLRPRG